MPKLNPLVPDSHLLDEDQIQDAFDLILDADYSSPEPLIKAYHLAWPHLLCDEMLQADGYLGTYFLTLLNDLHFRLTAKVPNRSTASALLADSPLGVYLAQLPPEVVNRALADIIPLGPSPSPSLHHLTHQALLLFTQTPTISYFQSGLLQAACVYPDLAALWLKRSDKEEIRTNILEVYHNAAVKLKNSGAIRSWLRVLGAAPEANYSLFPLPKSFLVELLNHPDRPTRILVQGSLPWLSGYFPDLATSLSKSEPRVR